MYELTERDAHFVWYSKKLKIQRKCLTRVFSSFDYGQLILIYTIIYYKILFSRTCKANCVGYNVSLWGILTLTVTHVHTELERTRFKYNALYRWKELQKLTCLFMYSSLSQQEFKERIKSKQ